MPILNDVDFERHHDHSVLRRERKRRIEMGREEAFKEAFKEGFKEGFREGLIEGERRIVLLLIGQRFGSVPPRLRKRLDALPKSKLEQMALRLLDARSLDELLG